MEDTILENPDTEDNIEPDEPLPAAVPAVEKHRNKERFTGDKIKDIADKAACLGSVSAIVVGFLIWSRSDNLAGFLVGLLIVVVGIFASYALASVLYSYGDMVENSFEQTMILKRLEEQRAAELQSALEAPIPAVEDRPEEDKNKLVAEAEAIQAEKTAALSAAQAASDSRPDEELNTDESRRRALAKKLKLPLHGVIDARMRRVAHFKERARYGIICPVCGRKQDSERDNCFFCDCRFLYDDEPVTGTDGDLLNRLRQLQVK
jgi:hypothetical protein